MRHTGVSLTSLVVVLLVGAATCDPPPPRKPLEGFVDLHTHPLSNLGFGGKLIYGGVGVGALLPSDPDCNPSVRAASEERALGHDRAVHGGWDLFSNRCGDSLRERVIHALQQANLGASDPPSDAFGFPTFQSWPVWNDITHQKMWVEWIRRSFSGGLRVMVALAVNNRTLGDLVSGPGDLPTDDKTAADLQIAEIKLFVAGHPDFMELAFTAEDIARITSIPKLAVVIGVEIDHLGNLQTASWSDSGPIIAVPSAGEVKAEIHRLYDAGVRYIFPIHLLDNAFGGTAAYVDLFNVSNTRESGAAWALKCACPVDGIDYTYQPPGFLEVAISIVKLGRAFVPDPGPSCPSGQRNSRALTAIGIEGGLRRWCARPHARQRRRQRPGVQHDRHARRVHAGGSGNSGRRRADLRSRVHVRGAVHRDHGRHGRRYELCAAVAGSWEPSPGPRNCAGNGRPRTSTQTSL